ncbi:hypothetical protein ABLG04_001226 [Pseudomonas aeruginosa]
MSKELNKAPVEQAGGDERAAFFKHLIGRHPAHETEIVRVVEHNYAAWKAWRARAALAQPSGEVVVTKNESGAIVSVTRQDKEGRVLSVIAESATLTAQAEQAEAERPEVVAWRYGFSGGIVSDKACLDEWKSGGEYQSLMTVAQHERIVGALRAERDGAIKLLGQSVWQKIERLTQERDAALARVAELERGKVYVEARRCDECQHGGINDSATGVAACHECDWTGPEPEEDKCPGCQRENCMAAACPQCGARYVLVASEEIAAPVAQAQHSVPAYVSYTTRPAESLAGIALRQLKDESRWVEIRDINAHAFPDMQSHSYYPAGTVIKLPAAAPGKEGV